MTSNFTLALVGCGNKKIEKSSEAKNMYTSEYFKLKRQWAEGCDKWRILSAEHGLLHPDVEIEPYDTVLSELNSVELSNWAEDVAHNLEPLLIDAQSVFILAGSDYYQPIKQSLTDSSAKVYYPFNSLRIGEQMSWLKNNHPPNQSTFDSY